ncbi:MAG: thioether cross-link-forming SCIFF peptide maturase [Bacillota bacterium]
MKHLSSIHRFTINHKQLVFDVESNALHEFDPAAWQALDMLEAGHGREAIVRALTPSHGAAAVSGALDEIESLQRVGLLWSSSGSFDAGAAPRVKALCLFLSEDCNLGCRYCFVARGGRAARNGHMSAAVGRAAMELLIRLSGERCHCEVDYFGGEPLLNRAVMQEITAFARQEFSAAGKEIAFTVTTNGLLLTPEVAEYMAQESFAAVLSLDGRPAVHDRMRPLLRGGGSYRVVLPHLLEYTGRRPKGGYYIRGTFTRFNTDFSRDVEHLYRLGFRYISMEPVIDAPDQDYALSEADLPELEREYEKLAAFYLECAAAGDPFSFFHFAIDLEKGPCLPKRLSGCGAGREYLAVTADGSIYPCHQLAGRPELRMGHVHEPENFNPALPESFIPAGPLQGQCRHCWARYYCGGGCRAASYLNSKPGEPYPLECALQRKRLECALYLHAAQF